MWKVLKAVMILFAICLGVKRKNNSPCDFTRRKKKDFFSHCHFCKEKQDIFFFLLVIFKRNFFKLPNRRILVAVDPNQIIRLLWYL